MDASNAILIALLLANLALVAFVAAAEAGLTSLSRARVRLMVGQGVDRAELLHNYVQERDSLLCALPLARNLAFVSAAVLATALLTRERGHGWEFVVGVILSGLLALALLQALSRALVAKDPERWGLRLAPFMGLFKLVFGVPARLLAFPSRAMNDAEDDEETLLRIFELEESEGPIEEDERKMIRGVFGLEDTSVREIMTPRTDIVALEVDSPAEQAVKLILDHGLSRIPVYDKNVDSVVGIVYAKDLFRYVADGMTAILKDVTRTPFWVPESKRVDELLTEMRRRRVHMAIVVDEYGGTAGLVTIEDLLEEIVGEIEDEYDRVEQQVVQISDSEALLDGRVSIDELNDIFHTDIKAEEYDTVGGCVFHLLGRIPVVGDETSTDGLKLQVTSVDGHRVKRIRVTVDQAALAEAEDSNGSGRKENNRNGRVF